MALFSHDFPPNQDRKRDISRSRRKPGNLFGMSHQLAKMVERTSKHASISEISKMSGPVRIPSCLSDGLTKLKKPVNVSVLLFGTDQHSDSNRCRVLVSFVPSVVIQTFIILCFSSAMSPKECENWVQGLTHLVKETLRSPYHVLVHVWLRKEFDSLKNQRNV